MPSQHDQHDLTQEALAVFQSRTSRTLSKEDVREITTNVTGFFAVLREWHAREEATAQATQRDSGAGT